VWGVDLYFHKVVRLFGVARLRGVRFVSRGTLFFAVFFFNLSGSTPEAEPKTRLICGVNWVLGLIA
jgi:hypothetical protein